MSLCRLADCSQELAKVNPDLAAWLAGVARKIRHGLPPGQALELVGSSARKERDRLLVQAGICLQRPGETWWQVAQRLAKRITSPPPRRPDTIDLLLV